MENGKMDGGYQSEERGAYDEGRRGLGEPKYWSLRLAAGFDIE